MKNLFKKENFFLAKQTDGNKLKVKGE